MMRHTNRLINFFVLVTLLISACQPIVAQPQVASPPLPEGGVIAQVNDIAMYYEIHGEGEPLLLIHTDIGSTEDFAAVIPAFVAAGYQTIAMDCRGRGRSTDSGQPFSYALMAADIVALMDKLGIDKAHIVGEADGGIIGLHMAIYYPERVGKLVSYGANYNINGLFPDFKDFAEKISLEDFDAMIGDAYRRLSPNPDYLPVMFEKLRHMILTQPNFTLEQLMSIRSPVLVYGGEKDDVIPVAHVRQLAAAIPNATLVIQPDGGHHLINEQPQLYLDTVLAFLAGELAAPAVGKYAAVNDIAMYYEVYGEGEPLLLIHGACCGINDFAPVTPLLSQEYQVIVMDCRGRGRSTDSGQPLSYALMAADIVALMDQLNIDKARIVGWSDGAIIGLYLAVHEPARVERLITYGANFTPDGLKAEYAEMVKNLTQADWEAMAGEEYRKVSPHPEWFPVMLEKIRGMVLTQPTFTLEELHTITAPVLVLDGEKEEVVQIDHVKKLAASIPNAELVLLKDTGHYAPYEKLDEWMAAVRTFLQK